MPCLEDGIALEAEPLVGQKTGMFIDQRPNDRIGALLRLLMAREPAPEPDAAETG